MCIQTQQKGLCQGNDIKYRKGVKAKDKRRWTLRKIKILNNVQKRRPPLSIRRRMPPFLALLSDTGIRQVSSLRFTAPPRLARSLSTPLSAKDSTVPSEHHSESQCF